jgi:hypothetical protein
MRLELIIKYPNFKEAVIEINQSSGLKLCVHKYFVFHICGCSFCFFSCFHLNGGEGRRSVSIYRAETLKEKVNAKVVPLAVSWRGTALECTDMSLGISSWLITSVTIIRGNSCIDFVSGAQYVPDCACNHDYGMFP